MQKQRYQALAYLIAHFVHVSLSCLLTCDKLLTLSPFSFSLPLAKIGPAKLELTSMGMTCNGSRFIYVQCIGRESPVTYNMILDHMHGLGNLKPPWLFFFSRLSFQEEDTTILLSTFNFWT